MRTDKIITEEIKKLCALKTTVPKTTIFGDDNHEKLDAQIEVLEKRMTNKQIEDRFYQDESAEEFQDGDNDLWSEAGTAWRWMRGEEDDSPSSAWE